MLIICTRRDFIYTFAAAAAGAVLAVLLLLLVFVLRRRGRSRRGAAAGGDDVRGQARATRVRDLSVGVGRRRGFCGATAAARLFLLAAGGSRRRGGDGDRRERVEWPVRSRRLMRDLGILLRGRRRVARVSLVSNRLVRWNRLHIAALFLEQRIKLK